MILFRKKLPKEGSVYTYKKKGNAYNGMTGIVFHHLGVIDLG